VKAPRGFRLPLGAFLFFPLKMRKRNECLRIQNNALWTKEDEMKRYFICFLTIGLLLAISSPVYAQTGKMAIVGTWKLISIERVDGKGNVIGPDEAWLGKKQTGLRIYDPNGYIMTQYMRLDPPVVTPPGSLQEIADAFGSCWAYFGTYEVKEMEGKEGYVAHHVQGCIKPEDVGRAFIIKFKISGNRLILTHMMYYRRYTLERVEKGE